MKAVKWSNGKHAYYGKRNDRFKRMFSKLHIPKKDLTQIFKQIEYELHETKREIIRGSLFTKND